MFPEVAEYRYRWLQSATDYSPPEVAKEAALEFMSAEPDSNNPDAWRRLADVAEKNDDVNVLNKAMQYAKASQQKHGADYGSYTRFGDVLDKLERPQEAIAVWKETANQQVNTYEAAESLGRMLNKIESSADKIPFAQEAFATATDRHGRIAMWLADAYLNRKHQWV